MIHCDCGATSLIASDVFVNDNDNTSTLKFDSSKKSWASPEYPPTSVAAAASLRVLNQHGRPSITVLLLLLMMCCAFVDATTVTARVSKPTNDTYTRRRRFTRWFGPIGAFALSETVYVHYGRVGV